MTNTLAERIKLRLLLLGTTARAASLAAGLSPDAIRSILNGSSRSPRAETIMALARVLKCDVDFLLGLTDEPGGDEADDGTVREARIPCLGELRSRVWFPRGERVGGGTLLVSSYPPAQAHQVAFRIGDKGAERWKLPLRSFVHGFGYANHERYEPRTGDLLVIQTIRDGLVEETLREVTVSDDGEISLTTGFVDEENNHTITFSDKNRNEEIPNILHLTPNTNAAILYKAIIGYIEMPGHPLLSEWDTYAIEKEREQFWREQGRVKKSS